MGLVFVCETFLQAVVAQAGAVTAHEAVVQASAGQIVAAYKAVVRVVQAGADRTLTVHGAVAQAGAGQIVAHAESSRWRRVDS